MKGDFLKKLWCCVGGELITLKFIIKQVGKGQISTVKR